VGERTEIETQLRICVSGSLHVVVSCQMSEIGIITFCQASLALLRYPHFVRDSSQTSLSPLEQHSMMTLQTRIPRKSAQHTSQILQSIPTNFSTS